MTDDRVAAYLAEVQKAVRQRDELMARMRQPAPVNVIEFNAAQDRLAEPTPRLLAAVEGVLDLHQRGRSVILGALCPRHKSHRYFSITRTEAAGVVACQACEATVYDSCTGCGPQMWQMSLGSCPARTAISAALLGEEPQ